MPTDFKQTCIICGGTISFSGDCETCPHCGSAVASALNRERSEATYYKAFRRAARLLSGLVAIAAFLNASIITAILAKAFPPEKFSVLICLAVAWMVFCALGLSIAYLVRSGGEMLADIADTIRNRR